ncbi:MAG: Rpp14/Pop5 family protein [Candidatus Caldarchaeum sp.]
MTRRVFKPRKRYLAVNTSRETSGEALEQAVKHVLTKLYGVDGLTKSGYRRIYSRNHHVFACYSEWVPRIILAISLTREMDQKPIVCRTLRISGTLKAVSGIR